jgi:hypothetical protein
VPKSQSQYILAIFFTLLLGIFYEAWNTLTLLFDTYYGLTPPIPPSPTSLTVYILQGFIPTWHTLVKSLLRVGTAVVAYFLMLIAMTYNTGLFVAVVVGLGLGHLLFGGVAARILRVKSLFLVTGKHAKQAVNPERVRGVSGGDENGTDWTDGVSMTPMSPNAMGMKIGAAGNGGVVVEEENPDFALCCN